MTPPHCTESPRSIDEPRSHTRILAHFAAFIFLVLVGCSSSDDQSSSSSGSSAQQEQSTGAPAATLPVLSVQMDNGAEITSREDYESAKYTLKSDAGQVLNDSTLDIRGRGNSTWTMPKKPYRVRLTNSTPLMGMPANRHWVLLANYSDKTLIRNDVAFEMSRRLGLEYTPRSTFVELWLNGTDRGIYQLTEHIRIAAERVNIPELNEGDTAPDKITGGYLIEIDARRGEDFCYESPRTGIVFCLSNPETLLEPGWENQRAYIQGYIDQTEEALFSDHFADPATGYAAYIDVDSVVNYYLVNEWVKNVDSVLFSSVYLHKKRDGKLTFGPVWDFDLAIGNVDYTNSVGDPGSPVDWYVRKASWFERLFQDPAFEAKVKARWAQLKASGGVEGIFTYIDNQALRLSKVQENNFQIWNILNTYVWPNRVVTGSYQGEVNAMRSWLRTRTDWIDGQLSQ